MAEREEDRWFSDEPPSALEDFWAVYEARHSEFNAELFRLSMRDPEISAVMRAFPPSQLEALLVERVRATDCARNGDWEPFHAICKRQGIEFARRGLRFTSWNSVLTAAMRSFIPFLVEAYDSDRARLIGVLHVSRRFFERLMTEVGEAYLQARDEMDNRHAREQAEVQRALTNRDAFYRALIEKSEEGISITGGDGRVRYMSPAGERIVGRTLEELRGKTMFESVHLDDLDRMQELADALGQRPGASVVSAFRIERGDGTTVWIEGTITNMLHDPAVEGVIFNFRDVTSRKAADEALRRTEEQLRHAQKMEAVGRLAGGVAHDFNNMLSVILGLSSLGLADLNPADPMYADLAEIHKAGQRAADLTRQLLMFSRQQVIEPKVLDLNAVIVNMERMLRRLIGEDVELTVAPSPALGRVRADVTSIEQVVMNLAVNARDAMPRGGKLTIETADVVLDEEYARLHHGTRPGPHVMLAVSDTGCGIARDVLPRIFEPFFTTKETGRGTGLGLSTVFGIVQQAGGSVWVYSEEDHGTTFKVYLPRVDASATAVDATMESAQRQGDETILLVEDDQSVRAVVRSILKRHGYHVIEAGNAGEALLECEQYTGPIHLLVTDVVMPHMNGPDLAKRLAQIRPTMRVLYMSGYTDDSVVRHGVLSSEFPFVQKPITPEPFTRKVRAVLDGTRATRRPPPLEHDALSTDGS